MLSMKRFAAVLLVLGFASCAHVGVAGQPDTTDPELAEAHRLTWAFYGCPGPAPVVLVVKPDDLTCTAPNGMPGFPVLLPDGWGCREGFDLVPGKISVAYQKPWSRSALRHEDMHACQAGRWIVDPWHLREEWQTTVPAARAVLEAKGL